MQRNICPKCSGFLRFCTQPGFTFKHKLKSDGSIRKISQKDILTIIRDLEGEPNPPASYIQCESCYVDFDFEEDEHGRICIAEQ